MSVTITIPDSVANSAHLTEAEVRQELAITLYQRKRLTLAQARQITNLTRLEFQRLLSSRRIEIYGVEDLEKDVENLRKLGRL